MGRSNSRTRRSRPSNQRLRSNSNSTSYSPSQVPYGGYRYRGALGTSPSYLSQPRGPSIRQARNLYATATSPTPRQPASRPHAVGVRVYQPAPSGVRPIQARGNTRAPQKAEDTKTMVCVDRQQRREILHALRKTGKAGQKPPVFNWKSKVHCKKR